MRTALSERSASSSRSSARRPFDPAAATTMQMHLSRPDAAIASHGSVWRFTCHGQTAIAELCQLSQSGDSITPESG